MAETVDSCPSSDSEPEEVPRKPFRKRRRFLINIPAVPVYSNKVQNSLKLLSPPKLPKQDKELGNQPVVISSSEEEEEKEQTLLKCEDLSFSPQQKKHHVKARIFDQSIRNLTISLSAAEKSLQEQRSGCSEDDVILVGVYEPQELMLKVRCRADLYRVCILTIIGFSGSFPCKVEGGLATFRRNLIRHLQAGVFCFALLGETEPLQRVVEHMSQILNVDPKRIILLHRDCELAPDATPAKLDLGVADIIDCIVETSSQQVDESGILLLRVQGKEKSSLMEITIQKGEPFEVLMNQYREAQGLGRCNLVFYFDGQRLTETLTPEQLEMESGDMIEVWN